MRDYVSHVFDKEFWLERAQESRGLNEQLTDPDVRQQMRTIAEGYERIALHAEDLAKLREKYQILE